MTRFFAIAALLAVASAATADSIDGFINLRGTDTQGNDIYEVSAANNFAADATSIALRFEGNFVNTFPAPLTFNADPAGFAGFSESFFVIPEGFQASDVLGADVVDSNSVLAGNFTVPGETAFITGGDAGGSILAVIAVPSGQEFTVDNVVNAQAAVAGEFQDINFIPEPSTAILAGLALVGFASRRNG